MIEISRSEPKFFHQRSHASLCVNTLKFTQKFLEVKWVERLRIAECGDVFKPLGAIRIAELAGTLSAAGRSGFFSFIPVASPDRLSMAGRRKLGKHL